MQPAGPGTALPRAFLHVGGLSIARQQAGLALNLGCARIIALTPTVGPEILELQQQVEGRGAQFHAITSGRALSGLVTIADELIVLEDGLIADPDEAPRLLEAGQGIMVQPAGSEASAGFERLDVDFASGGAMRLPGRLVDRLTELPEDSDPVAALTRLALQAGLPRRQLSAERGPGLGWAIIHDDAEAHALESAWLQRRMPEFADVSPSSWLSRQLAARLGPALLHMPRGNLTLLAATIVLTLLGLGSGWLGWPALGLCLCLIGVGINQTREILNAVECNALFMPAPRFANSASLGWGIDLVQVLLAGWGAPSIAGGINPPMFAAAMVLLTSRLARAILKSKWRGWLGDRGLLALVFLFGLVSGQATLIWQVGAIALAGAALIWPATQRSDNVTLTKLG